MSEVEKKEFRDKLGQLINEIIEKALKKRGLSAKRFFEMASDDNSFFRNIVLMPPFLNLLELPDKVIARLTDETK